VRSGPLDRADGGKRLAKTCLELGGKNPLIVCDDADLQNAVTWTLGSASATRPALRRGSRILVFDGVYDSSRRCSSRRSAR
jgi:aldehyde dehydrogenase (NAD+)